MSYQKEEMTDDDEEILTSEEQELCSEKSNYKGYLHFIPARYVFTLMGFGEFFYLHALRVTLNVAIVAMVNSSINDNNVTLIDECPFPEVDNSTETIKKGEFDWDEKLQGTVLGSFYYTYVLTQLLGGRMAEIYSSKWVYGITIVGTSVLSIVTPLLARVHVAALIVVRILEGLLGGPSYPAMHVMLGHWLPRSQRSLLSAVVFIGGDIGTVVSMLLTGIFCESDFLGGWPAGFYVLGTGGIVWFIFWIFLIFDSPEDHPRISKQELIFIQRDQSRAHGDKKAPVPWKNVLTSVPIWMLIATHFGQDFGLNMFLTELPSYMKNILHYNMETNGMLSALPYIFRAFIAWITGTTADFMVKKRYLSISVTRKVCNTIGSMGPALCLVGVVLAGCSNNLNVILFTLAMALNGFSFSGYMVNHLDLAPDFAGTLMGLTNGLSEISGFIAPAFVGILTEHKQTLHQWSIIFISTSVVYLVTGVLFATFGSAELQWWGVANHGKEITKCRKEDEDNSCRL
ncbi:putative inorganic phosphate cotransporter isoform X2 [Tachypleus tridentatus]|uniref:putative inorganic phosphate cotransporter isoform X2 n=1 Tax=Tachypleus tridentatus TaxID=6853 RepID=UPI003FCFF381